MVPELIPHDDFWWKIATFIRTQDDLEQDIERSWLINL